MAKRFEAVLKDQLRDPDLAAEWERTALARALSIAVLRYRTSAGLSQRQLAERLGWKQAQIGRLELGEHTPTLDTIVRLARILQLEFLIDVRPAGRCDNTWLTPAAEALGVSERLASDRTRVLVAAG